MKITNLEVIPFRVPATRFRDGAIQPQVEITQTITKVTTDEGAEGYYLGGYGHGDLDGIPPDQRALIEGRIKSMVLGQDPYDREKFWQLLMVAKTIPENVMSILDMVLWDLQARAFGIPVYKLLGGCRDKVKAYASSWPNLGPPEVYAQHALECKKRGYTHYKIHPYYFYDPITNEQAPGRPSHIKADIEACRLIREAVGDDMVLSFDPWGTYCNYEEAYKVGRALEELDFYWFEHPMPEYRVASYEKLTRELEIPVLAPEVAAGGVFTRADWIRRGASDMSRIDVLRGGITGVMKTAAVSEAYGVKCEIHMSGFANLQTLGATSEDTCEYYERGLEAPGLDYDKPQPYLEAIGDAMDNEGYVHLPKEPGMGYRFIWDYINENRIDG